MGKIADQHPGRRGIAGTAKKRVRARRYFRIRRFSFPSRNLYGTAIAFLI